jgi:undecaprenyl phosphate-alpha-L-ara4N flippase subunit ArnE
MKTKWYAILLMVVCTLFTSTAQVFYKIGAAKLPLIFTNYQLLAGLFLYALGAVVFVIALKFGEVTILYPIIATSYIWVALLSWWIFNDVMNIYKSLGIIAIVAGITIISIGGKKS